MQQYCTTAKPGVTIPDDDGRSLLAVNQYRLEVQEIGRLSLAQEQKIVQLARTGDEEARALLIESCLGYVYSLGVHYSLMHPSNTDAMDLAQVGNEAIVRHLDESLRSRYTCAFLRLVARRAISTYCVEDKLIRVPCTSYRKGKRAPLTISLTAPLYGDDDRTVLDLLEDANWQELDACLEVV